MRICHVTAYFQGNMGYQENYLPAAQKRLGHDEHQIRGGEHTLLHRAGRPRVAAERRGVVGGAVDDGALIKPTGERRMLGCETPQNPLPETQPFGRRGNASDQSRHAPQSPRGIR